MPILHINTDAAVVFANKLEKISKSALPIAARQTLNDTALDVKQNTMPASARDTFTQRQKNFFVANSKVEFATGMQINSMRSIVGFYENKLQNASTNYAIKDLEEQEQGGKIDGKSFIPTDQARSGKRGLVKPNARLREILRNNKIIKTDNQKGKTKPERFVQAVLKAGVGGYVLGSVKSGENFLWRVNQLNRFSSSHKTVHFNLSRLYDWKKGRSVSVNKTNFMREASIKSGQKMESFFINRAKAQLAKYYK